MVAQQAVVCTREAPLHPGVDFNRSPMPRNVSWKQITGGQSALSKSLRALSARFSVAPTRRKKCFADKKTWTENRPRHGREWMASALLGALHNPVGLAGNDRSVLKTCSLQFLQKKKKRFVFIFVQVAEYWMELWQEINDPNLISCLTVGGFEAPVSVSVGMFQPLNDIYWETLPSGFSLSNYLLSLPSVWPTSSPSSLDTSKPITNTWEYTQTINLIFFFLEHQQKKTSWGGSGHSASARLCWECSQSVVSSAILFAMVCWRCAAGVSQTLTGSASSSIKLVTSLG